MTLSLLLLVMLHYKQKVVSHLYLCWGTCILFHIKATYFDITIFQEISTTRDLCFAIEVMFILRCDHEGFLHNFTEGFIIGVRMSIHLQKMSDLTYI